jgi:hypothetical protein
MHRFLLRALLATYPILYALLRKRGTTFFTSLVFNVLYTLFFSLAQFDTHAHIRF